jgi:4-hydroxybenzoate polyprenyltransferase
MANLPTETNKPKTVLSITSLIKVARPIQWIKNLTIFAPLIFTGDLYHKAAFINVIWAFVAFCMATSATYIFNDILDAPVDRLHPIKKERPIASGKLSVSVALIEAAILATFAFILAETLSHPFFLIVLVYIFIQIIYSLFLKNLPIVDILIIASGFVLRVYGGAFIVNAHLSVWFLLCVISVALFLASGKRRAELGVIAISHAETRKSLSHYSIPLLDSYVTMFGNAAWLSWALFTFFESPRASLPLWLFLAEISKTTTINKLLMITIPVAIFGIMRYESLIFQDRAESPEKVLLSDKSLIASVVIWTALVVLILYGGVSSFV